jgi:hypothetical protein
MKITRRLVGALMAAALSFAVIGMSAPAQARDTGWDLKTVTGKP